MTGKKVTPARRARASLKLSTPRNVARLLDLLAEGGSDHLFESAQELINVTGEADIIAGWGVTLPRALRAAERAERSEAAAEYYAALQDILRRTAAGETLEAIERDANPGDVATKAAPTLSSPAGAGRLLALLTDPEADEAARRRLQLEVDRLTEGAGVASLPQPEHPAAFLAVVRAAADVVENARDLKARDYDEAREAYSRLREIVARAMGGKALAGELDELLNTPAAADTTDEADDGAHKLTLAEAESWAASTATTIAMQRDEEEALGFVALLEYLENEGSNSNRAAVCNAARNAAAPLVSGFDDFLRSKTAEALTACRERVAGKGGE